MLTPSRNRAEEKPPPLVPVEISVPSGTLDEQTNWVVSNVPSNVLRRAMEALTAARAGVTPERRVALKILL